MFEGCNKFAKTDENSETKGKTGIWLPDPHSQKEHWTNQYKNNFEQLK